MCLILSLLLQEEEREAMERAKEEGIFADMPTGAIVEDDPDSLVQVTTLNHNTYARISATTRHLIHKL